MTNLIAALVVLALMAALAIGLARAIAQNLRQGQRFREELAERVGRLRLRRILGRFGLDEATYLHAERVVDIERNMSNCAACPTIELCEDALDSNVPGEQFTFCPNQKELGDAAKRDIERELAEHHAAPGDAAKRDAA